MTSSEDFVINCIYQQIWGLFEPSGELAQEYLRIRYMQFIEIETSHLHSTPVCRSACADIKLIGQTLVCPIMREENPIYIWYQEAEQDLKGIYKAHECFSAFGGIFVYTGAFQNF